MRGWRYPTPSDWSFLTAKDPTVVIWPIGDFLEVERLQWITQGVGAEPMSHVTSLDCRVIEIPLQCFLKEHTILLDTMPRPKMCSIEEELNFTVKDIQGPK